MLRSSRELSSRLKIDGHKRPHRFRRTAWWFALWAGVGSLLWISWQHVRGENAIYQAGPVGTPHRLIENNCEKCHTTWTPLQRLVSLSDDKHSIDNQKCELCHRVTEHHANQFPRHAKVSCAVCHQEHEGAEMLVRPSNRFCIACHSKLETLTHPADPLDDTVEPTKTFASHVAQFDRFDGHPEFRWKTLLSPETTDAKSADKHGAFRSIEHFQRPGDAEARWQDRGRIRFNHAAHLKAERDANGQLVYGLIGKDRQFTDLSQSCNKCHEPDGERRYMQPISFERHCRECHPLLFDHEHFPGQSVPHETPDIVRGFLTENYTLRALKGIGTTTAPPQKEEPSRPIPGHRDFQNMSQNQAQEVLDAVGQAEVIVRQHRHRQFGYEATGGCRYCHQVEPAAAKPTREKQPLAQADWKIVPTNIPQRWLMHGEFHHGSQRLLNCSACHVDVEKSKSTGEVLIPSINVCRACHSEEPALWAEALLSKTEDQKSHNNPSHSTTDLKAFLANTRQGARFDCMECHRYHNHHGEKLSGPLTR